jgi:HEAT repeat protein
VIFYTYIESFDTVGHLRLTTLALGKDMFFFILATWIMASQPALGQIALEVDDLLPQLQDENRWTRVSAAEALGKIKSTVAIGALSEALSSNDEALVMAAIRSLGEIGTHESVLALSSVLSHPSKVCRYDAVIALGRIGTPDTQAPLIRAFSDEDGFIRFNALNILGLNMGQDVYPVFKEALRDADQLVSSTALIILQDSQDPEAKSLISGEIH